MQDMCSQLGFEKLHKHKQAEIEKKKFPTKWLYQNSNFYVDPSKLSIVNFKGL
jgi:hypothetical protein